MKKIVRCNASEGRIAPLEGEPNRERRNLATWVQAHQCVSKGAGIDDPLAGAVSNILSPVNHAPPAEAVRSRNQKNSNSGRRTLAESLAELSPPPLPPARKKEPMQRLAVDIPVSLHAAIKRVADRPGGSLRDDLAALLEWYYRGR